MYGYGSNYDTTVSILGVLAAMTGAIMIISLAVSLLMIISLWKIYKKAGKNGWESIIPIYNIIVLLQIVELPMWYIALFFVPIANIYAMFKIYIELAHKFGKSTGFGVLTVFFSVVCLPILAFGKNNVYNGNNNTSNVNNNTPQTHFDTNNTFAFQNENTGMENNNLNNQNIQQPFMFNQNINTNINPMPTMEQPNNNVVNQMNTIPTPTPVTQNIATNTFEQPTYQMPGAVTNSQPVMNQPENTFTYDTPVPVVNEQPAPITQNVGTNTFEQSTYQMPGAVPNSQPVMNQPENTFTHDTPAPAVNEQPVPTTQNVGTNTFEQPMSPMPGVVINQQPTVPNQNNFNQNM